MTDNFLNIEIFIEEKNSLIDTIINDFGERFNSTTIDDFNIFNIGYIKSQLNNENLNSFGNEKIESILNNFSNNYLSNDMLIISPFERTQLLNEWQDFKSLFYYTYSKLKNPFEAYYENYNNSAKNFCKLYEFYITIPVSTVICETGFSIQNFIKNKTRSRICDSNLEISMRIFFQGESLQEFCFDGAIEFFNKLKDRRNIK